MALREEASREDSGFSAYYYYPCLSDLRVHVSDEKATWWKHHLSYMGLSHVEYTLCIKTLRLG